MKIINDGNRRLEVINIDVLMGVCFIVFGGGLAYACLVKVLEKGHGVHGVMDWIQTIPFVFSAVFF